MRVVSGKSNRINRQKDKVMMLPKNRMLISTIIFFGLVFIFHSSHAEIYKWVDEKGTVHFTEDPATIREKYQG